MTDRTVHARYKDMDIVRYDRAGAWYLEPTLPGLPRQRVNLRAAALAALWGEANAGGVIHQGLPGALRVGRGAEAVWGDDMSGMWTTRPIQCEHCGRMVAAHDGKPCPFKEAEHKQRLRHAEAEHQARLAVFVSGQEEPK